MADAGPSPAGPDDVARWDSRTREVHGYWVDRHPAPGVLPGRRHIDPAALKSHLPLIWLLDIQPDPFRARYRVLGTRLVEIAGRDLTGRWIDEVSAEAAAHIYPTLRQVTAGRHAAHYRGRAYYNNPDHRRIVEYVLLPLAADGRTVDMVLGHSVYSSALAEGAWLG